MQQRQQVPDGAAIRRLREAKGWSRARLVKVARLTSEIELVLIEHNLRPTLSGEKWVHIARALGVSAESLRSEANRQFYASIKKPVTDENLLSDNWTDDFGKTN